MNPITIIMMIFERFFPIVDSTELERIRGDANSWYDKIDVNLENEPLSKAKLFFTNWYAKLLLAILYFVVVKQLMEYLTTIESVTDGYQQNNNIL